MIDDLVHLEHQAQLGALASVLESHGVTHQLIEPNDDLPVTTLMVSFGSDDKERERSIGVSILPFDEGEGLDATQLVQFYSHLPIEIDDDSLAVCQRAVAMVNGAMAIGHFGMQGSNLFYRYVLAVPADQVIDTEMTPELLGLLGFHQEHFGDYFEGLVEDEIALSSLPELLAQD